MAKLRFSKACRHLSVMASAAVSALVVTSVSALLLQAPFSSQANASVDATQLDYVALDSSINCKQIFFRSSDHSKNTIYMMPNVVASAGPDGKRLYDIVPTTDPDVYFLNLRLFFPERGVDLASRGASSFEPDTDDCHNSELIKHAINRDIRDENEKIQTVATFPITSVEVTIPGFKHAARIGRGADGVGDKKADEVDILAYKGSVLTATFVIDETEKNYFVSQVVDADGIASTVKMRFQAKSRDGRVAADLDVDALSAAFAAAVKGKATLTKAEVSTALKASLDNRSLIIVSEAGKSDTSAKVADQIIAKILKDMDSAVEVATAATTAGDTSLPGEISVAVVLNLIKTKISRHIVFEQIAVAETATAQTEIRIKVSNVKDPSVHMLEIRADYLEPSTGFYINAGQIMSISASSWSDERIEYKQAYRQYLNKTEVENLNLGSQFEILNSRLMQMQDEEINGKLIAIGKQTQSFTQFTYPGEYRWLRSQTIPERIRVASNVVPPTQEAFMSLPVGLSFSNLGDTYRVSLARLFEPNDWWAATFDETSGRLILKAKRNLGLVQFRDLMSEKDPNQVRYGTTPVILDQVAQEYRGMTGAVKQTWAPVVLQKDNRPITYQRTYRFAITKPIDDEALGVPSVDAPGSPGPTSSSDPGPSPALGTAEDPKQTASRALLPPPEVNPAPNPPLNAPVLPTQVGDPNSEGDDLNPSVWVRPVD